MGTSRVVGLTMMIAVIATVGSGCGSSDKKSDSSQTKAAAAPAPTTATPSSYDGPEKNLPATYVKPDQKPGANFTVGYLSPDESDGFLHAVSSSARATTTGLGGKFVLKDAQQNIDTQVTECNELLAQRVNVMLIYPLDPKALGPCLAKAKAQKIPVVAQDTPPDVSQPLLPGYASTVLQGRDEAAYAVANAAAKAIPGGTFALLGLGAPVPLLTLYMNRVRYWAEKAGMHFTTRVDTKTGSPSDSAAAASAIVAKAPDSDVIIAYADPAARAAESVAQANGKSKMRVTGVSGFALAVPLLESGQMIATYALDATGIGKQMVWGGYDLVTDQHLPLPKKILVPGELVTKQNADSFPAIK